MTDKWAAGSEVVQDVRDLLEALTAAESRIAALEEALRQIKYKAGSHPVDVSYCREHDPGFAGIYAVAETALAGQKETGAP